MTTDPRIDAYIAARAEFARPILHHVRARFHAVLPEVEEAIKWSMPFFLLDGKPLANMAGFKAHARFGFWKREGPAAGQANEQEGARQEKYGQLTSLADLPPDAEIDRLIREAAALMKANSGGPVRAARAPKPDLPVPPELAKALADDDAAAAHFNAFPPGCRREYCEWIGEAKRPETREKRVAEALDWIRAGKRRNWKYENC